MTFRRLADRPRAALRIDELADLITPMAVRVAASLRLAEHIDNGMRSVEELAAKTATHQTSLAALLRHLIRVDVFAKDAGGGLVLTRLGKQLRLAQEFLDMESSVGRAELSLVRLLDSVRSGQPAYPLLFGCTFWEDLVARPCMKASFDAMTDRHLENELAPLLAEYDWSSVSHVVDLGAGNGELMIRLLSSFACLGGTIVERPGNTEPAERNLAGADLTHRCAVVEGNFFEPLTYLPRGTYILSSVLHDFSDAAASQILRRCSEALDPSESLLVIDSFSDDRQIDTHMDVRMLALFGGRQRTLEDMARLAQESDLRVVTARPLRKKWLIELKLGAATPGAGSTSRVGPDVGTKGGRETGPQGTVP